MSFTFQIESNPKYEILYLFGDIDEGADFDLIQLKNSAQLIIDLKNIRHLNSLGLRNWVKWIKELKSYSGGIILRNCPNPVVHQINILDGFLPLHAIIESLDVPYVCSSCDHSTLYLALRGRDFQEMTADAPDRLNLPQNRQCEQCGEKMEPDIISAKHFKFLKRRHS